MDVIEERVTFFRFFKMRGLEIYAPDTDRIFESAELGQILFRDSELKNNSKLVLCEPAKKKVSEDNEPEESDEEGEDEIIEEEGEEEVDDMDEDNDDPDGQKVPYLGAILYRGPDSDPNQAAEIDNEESDSADIDKGRGAALGLQAPQMNVAEDEVASQKNDSSLGKDQ